MTSSKVKSTPGSRRDEARRRAAAAREAQRRQERRRRNLTQAIVGVAVIAIVVGIGIAVQASRNKTSGPLVVPTAAVNRTGFAVGPSTAKVTVDAYEDFQCPVCREFETQSAATLQQLVTQGKIRLIYHPIAILDRYSTTKYSTRAASASACAADAGVFPRFHSTLYAQQPPENSAGLTDAKLIQLGQQSGASDASFASCVKSGKYKPWVKSVTDASSKRGVNGTPTIYVNGKVIGGGSVPTNAQLLAAITATAG